jgi:hypothetical protein
MPTYMYHWTHRSNLASILATGLDPQYARGRLRAVWLCEESRVLWAAAHVAAGHQCEMDSLVLLRVRVDRLTLTRTCWPLVRTTAAVIRPRHITGCKSVLGTRWQSLRTAAKE